MFAGFPPDALFFYEGLEADNSRSYWTARREIYEGSVREPMEDLVEAKGLRLGVGAWHFEPELLRRIRTAIDDDGRGRSLQDIAARLDEEGMPLYAPELKTAPRGFAKDHPRIELLRRKRFAATALLEPGLWLHTRAALDRAAEQWRLATPLNAWLERAAA